MPVNSKVDTQHIRRFGRYHLDMNDLPDPLEDRRLDFLK